MRVRPPTAQHARELLAGSRWQDSCLPHMSRTPLFVLAAALIAAGCGLENAVPLPDTYCTLTGLPNYGCTRVVTLVDGPDPLTWPAGARIDIRAYPARPNSGQGTSVSRSPWLVSAQIEITASQSPVMPAGDTLSMWVIARIIDDPRPILPGVELNLYAVDSAKRVVTFVKQGELRHVDTVRLSMKKLKP